MLYTRALRFASNATVYELLGDVSKRVERCIIAVVARGRVRKAAQVSMPAILWGPGRVDLGVEQPVALCDGVALFVAVVRRDARDAGPDRRLRRE